jgi:phosphoribosylpyrophosphate synthetase
MESRYGFLRLEPREIVDSGWIHAFGVYYPRHQATEHQHSDWSRAVILAKRRASEIIDRFGVIIAGRLERWIGNDVSHVITHVPAEPEPVQYLFDAYGRGAPELLAESIYRHLGNRHNVHLETLIMQLRPKGKKQHQCAGMAARKANVRGLYAVSDRLAVEGCHVILVDDVLTSGATMRECASILRNAGAKTVMGVALARTVRLQDGDPVMEENEQYEDTMPASALMADRLAG